MESVIAGAATLLGAAMVCGFGRPRIRILAALLGFAAGVMVCVVFIDLLPYSYRFGSLIYSVCGFCLGVLLMTVLERVVGRLTRKRLEQDDKEKGLNRYFRLGVLVAAGIALHDLPEGMAIAAGHAVQEETGLLLAIAIGLHNIPEGIASATPFVIADVKVSRILLLMLVISLFTPLGAWLGILLIALGDGLISLSLGLAGGAMLSLALQEMVPEAWRLNRLFAGGGFLAGCALPVLMIFSFPQV
jgi:ZIP family zinc transporter